MAISNPFADLKDAPYSNFDVARANAALGEDSDEGGGGMDSLRRMHTMAVWLGDQYDRDLKQGVFEDPDGITEFNVDEILQSTYLDPNTDQPVRWSSADVLSKLTGIPKRSLPELLGIAGIETGPRAAAAALGSRFDCRRSGDNEGSQRSGKATDGVWPGHSGGGGWSHGLGGIQQSRGAIYGLWAS